MTFTKHQLDFIEIAGWVSIILAGIVALIFALITIIIKHPIPITTGKFIVNSMVTCVLSFIIVGIVFMLISELGMRRMKKK